MESKFVVGFHSRRLDLEEFREYYERTTGHELGKAEEEHIASDPAHLILFRAYGQIIGHAIWHESNTRKHKTGGRPRDKEDIELLEKLAGGKRNFVELHELWLGTEHRGKGYGKRFFEFFENFVAGKEGYDSIVHYAYDPAAIAICRKRGYNEAYEVESGGRMCHVFWRSMNNRE